MQGTLIEYIATSMLMTLIIRTESGEEVTLLLNDEMFTWLAIDYTRVRHAYVDSDGVSPDKITCEIVNGIPRTIVLKDGIEIEE